VPEVYIKPENIFWIGSRSIDAGEQRLIDERHLHIYSAELVQAKGMAWVIQNIIHQMHEQGIAHIHLSIDVDAIDPKLFPATSVPEPNGLTFEDFNIFVQSLRQIQHQIAAIDWVEYNPTLDKEQHECGKWCIGAIDQLLKTVLE
jgi:arginase